MPTHSPLPWSVGPSTEVVLAGNGYVTASCYAGRDVRPSANAAFIVRAVNSHAALLEACERIIAADDAKSLSAIVDAMPALRAAVQLATGGSDDQ